MWPFKKKEPIEHTGAFHKEQVCANDCGWVNTFFLVPSCLGFPSSSPVIPYIPREVCPRCGSEVKLQVGYFTWIEGKKREAIWHPKQ